MNRGEPPLYAVPSNSNKKYPPSFSSTRQSYNGQSTYLPCQHCYHPALMYREGGESHPAGSCRDIQLSVVDISTTGSLCPLLYTLRMHAGASRPEAIDLYNGRITSVQSKKKKKKKLVEWRNFLYKGKEKPDNFSEWKLLTAAHIVLLLARVSVCVCVLVCDCVHGEMRWRQTETLCLSPPSRYLWMNRSTDIVRGSRCQFVDSCDRTVVAVLPLNLS